MALLKSSYGIHLLSFWHTRKMTVAHLSVGLCRDSYTDHKIDIHMHACLPACIHTYIHKHACMHTYKHTDIHRTNIHTYKHTYILQTNKKTVEIHFSSNLGSRLKDTRLCQDEKSLSHFVICDF